MHEVGHEKGLNTTPRPVRAFRVICCPGLKASLCKSCKVEQAYTGGFHNGRCGACCGCPGHTEEREALRKRGLWSGR